MRVVDGPGVLLRLQRLRDALRLGVHVLILEALAFPVHVQETVAGRAEVEVHDGRVRLGLLHGGTRPDGLLVHVAGVAVGRVVEAAVHGVGGHGRVVLEHLVVGCVVARSNDNRFRVDLHVLVLAGGNDGAGHRAVAIADEALALRAPTDLAAQVGDRLVQSRHEHRVAVHVAHARTLVEREVDGFLVLVGLVEDVRDRVLGVIGALVVAVPQKRFEVFLGGQVVQPVEARTALARELPQQRLLHAALRPVDPTSHDVVVVRLLQQTLVHQALLHLGVETGDVHAARDHRLGVLVDGDDLLRAFFQRGDGGAAAAQTRADDEHVAVLGVRDLVGGDGFGRDLPAVHAGHVGAGRGAAFGDRHAARRSARRTLRRRLGRIAAALRSAPRQPGNRRARERGAAQTQERTTRKTLLLLFLHEYSLLRCLPAAPCRRVAPTVRPTLQVIIPLAGGTSPPPPDFPLPGGCLFAQARRKG